MRCAALSFFFFFVGGRGLFFFYLYFTLLIFKVAELAIAEDAFSHSLQYIGNRHLIGGIPVFFVSEISGVLALCEEFAL